MENLLLRETVNILNHLIFFFLLNTVGPFKASAENFANAFSNMSTS